MQNTYCLSRLGESRKSLTSNRGWAGAGGTARMGDLQDQVPVYVS